MSPICYIDRQLTALASVTHRPCLLMLPLGSSKEAHKKVSFFMKYKGDQYC